MEYNWPTNFKRNFSLFVVILMFYGCGQKSTFTTSDYKSDLTFIECKIIKIDRFKNYYFIYTKGTSDGRGYKIISAITPIANENQVIKRKMNIKRIEVNNIYRLRLTWVSEPILEEKKGNYMEFERCIMRFPNVKICTETGFELYESIDIKGLEVNTIEK